MAWLFVGGGVFIGFTNIALKLASTKGIGLVPIATYFAGVGLGLLAYALWQKPQALVMNLAAPSGLQWAAVGVAVGLISNILLFTALGRGAPAGLGFTIFNVVST
ncbi:MAG: hypothetical protein INF43_03115, partial [Alphaproteobacteria bacterium]|nr:hypothetical protein [Alphaproteobacteria bacterium]